MKSFAIKRCISTILVLALVITSINFRSIIFASGAENEIKVTDGQIIAKNYVEELSLSEQEIAVLNSEHIRGDVHSFLVPTDKDNLISVDFANKEVKADDYTDEIGNVWKAVSAEVVYDQGTETVELSDGAGSFKYSGNKYSVNVKYETYKNIGNQNIVANIPAYLAKGVYNLDTLSDTGSTYFMLMETMIPNMLPLVDGSMEYVLNDGAAKEAINALNAQLNDMGSLKLMFYADDYAASASKVQYLIESGSAVKTCFLETFNYVKTIVDDSEVADVIEKAKATGKYKAKINQINRAMTQLKLFTEELAEVYADDWKALSIAPVKEGADYGALDELVLAVANSTERTFEPKNPLVAASTVISKEIVAYDVTVRVNANVIPKDSRDSNELAALEEQVFKVTLPENASPEEIIAAVEESGAEAKAIESWNWGIDTENYVRSTTMLTGNLTADMDYVITYNPVKCALSFTYDKSLNKEVYYGYNHTFEVSSDAEVSYDYKVGDDTYMQGEVYTVTGDTSISRTEGKSRESFSLGQLVAEDYKDVLSDKEKTILNAKALKTEAIAVRVVDNEVKNQIVIDGHSVTANNYDAGYESLSWKPVNVKAVKGSEIIEGSDFSGNTASLESLVYDYAQVKYSLQLKEGDDEDVRATLNLPSLLVSEMAAQKSDMDQLMLPAVYDNLGSINKTMLNAMAANLGAESQEAIAKILSEEEKIYNHETNTFYLYEYLNAYKNEGMTYYYRDGHHSMIKGQVEALAKYLSVIAGDELLPDLLESLGYGAYKDKIDDAVAQLNALKNGFAVPNAAIDTESEALSELVSAMEAEGVVNNYDKADGLVMERELKEASETTVFIKLLVNVLDGNGQIKATAEDNVSLLKGQVYDETTAALVDSTLNSMLSEFSVDTENYTVSMSAQLPSVGSVIEKTVSVTYNWSPAVYTVMLEGSNEEFTFTFDKKQISLPVCNESGFAFGYTIGDKYFETSADNSRFEFDKFFTNEEFAALFASGKELVITREKIDINKREILSFVNDLNNAIADGAAVDAGNNLSVALIPVEAEGQLSLVLRLSMEDGTNTLTDILMSSFMLLVEELMMSKFGYVELNEESFINDGLVSVQTLINMVLDNEGFGTNIYSDIVDDKGDIIELDIPDAVVVGAEDNKITVGDYTINDADVLGGKLLSGKLELGLTVDNIIGEMPLYITIEDFDKNSEDLLAKKNDVNEKYTIEVKDNKLDVELRLTDSTYMTLMAPLILNEQQYLSDIEAVTLQQVMDALEEMNEPVQSEDTDGITITPVESRDSFYMFDMNCSVEMMFSMVEIQDALKNMIKEKESGVNAPVKLTLNNMDNEYEAIILDHANGGLNIVEDAKSAAAEMSKSSVMILLKNVDGDIKFTEDAIINLNGFMVRGLVTSEGELLLINNTMQSDLYKVDKDNEGNSVIEIDSSYLYNKEESALKELANALAYDFLLMNNTWAALSINKTEIYRQDAFVVEDTDMTTVDNMAEFKSRISGAGYETLADSFYEMLKDEEKALTAAENNTALAVYDLQAYKWDVKKSNRTEIVEELEQITIITTVKTGDEVINSTLSIMVIPTTKPSPTPVVTETPSPTPVVTETPGPTPVVTETPVPTPVVTETPVPTPVVTETPSPTPVVTVTPSPTPVVTETPTPTPSETVTPSPTPVVTEAPTPTPSETVTPSPTPSETITPTPTPEITEEVIKLGDVTEDGIIDASDALAVLKHAAKLEILSEKLQQAANVNKDDVIDATDALKILKVAAKVDAGF